MRRVMKTLFARVTAPVQSTPPLTPPETPAPPSRAAAPARRPPRRVFVRDLVLPALVGIYEREKAAPQRLRVNLDLAVTDPNAPPRDAIADVVSYEEAVKTVAAAVEAGHVNLLETLAEEIAARLLRDARVEAVTVRLEKLDAFPDCGSVGIEIVRGR